QRIPRRCREGKATGHADDRKRSRRPCRRALRHTGRAGGASQSRHWGVRERTLEARSSGYHNVYARWQRDPEGFWADAAREIDWYEPAKKVFDPTAGVYGRWFVGGLCNTCWNA